MKRFAKIWVSAPHETDGYFVELLERFGKRDCQIDSTWCPTVVDCEQWAKSQGAQKVIRFESEAL